MDLLVMYKYAGVKGLSRSNECQIDVSAIFSAFFLSLKGLD